MNGNPHSSSFAGTLIEFRRRRFCFFDFLTATSSISRRAGSFPLGLEYALAAPSGGYANMQRAGPRFSSLPRWREWAQPVARR
jgi:hypothetical protein